MSIPTNPINEYFNQKRYMRHKHKLQTIQSQRHKPTVGQHHSSIQKLRQYSIAFHAQRQQEQINNQNEKLLEKLLDISKRKKSLYIPTSPIPKITTFQNPARKKRQKMITEMNMQMAERMLNLGSGLDHKAMRRSMEQYEKLKKTIINNKRFMSQSGHIGPSLPLMKKSWHGPDENLKSVKIQYEQSEQKVEE